MRAKTHRRGRIARGYGAGARLRILPGGRRRPMRPPRGVSHAIWILWFFSGNERMRCPVALKNALSTAGAATQIVGSPTPPQGSLPPDGIRIDSTFGISPMRIEL